MKPEEELVRVADSFVGIKEEGGDNRGFWIEQFQKSVDGTAEREAWCVGFVQFCAKQVDKKFGIKNYLYPTESVITLWERLSLWQRLPSPMIGSLAFWQHYDGIKPTRKGHVGIVRRVFDNNTFQTVEGNTSDGSSINREGDGVFFKVRPLTQVGSMRLLGFAQIWD